MITSKRVLIAVALSVFLATVCHAHEGDNTVLIGLKHVVVSISDLKPEIEKDGLSVKQLQKAVDARLRRAGIQVLSVEEGEQKGAPLFHAEVNLVRSVIQCGPDQKDIVMYSGVLMISLKESVQVTRTKTAAGVPTWTKYYVGATGDIYSIRSKFDNILDEFTQAWQYSNPKK